MASVFQQRKSIDSADYLESEESDGTDVSPDLASLSSSSTSSRPSPKDVPEWYSRIFAGKKLLRKRDNQILLLPSEETLNPHSMLALYYGAGWSVPCEVFLPKLIKFHDALYPMFEVMYVSSDLSQADMSEQMLEFHGDWLGIPFSDTLSQQLINHYKVTSMPTVLVLDRHAMPFCHDGHTEILKKGLHAFYTWAEDMEYPEEKS